MAYTPVRLAIAVPAPARNPESQDGQLSSSRVPPSKPSDPHPHNSGASPRTAGKRCVDRVEAAAVPNWSAPGRQRRERNPCRRIGPLDAPRRRTGARQDDRDRRPRNALLDRHATLAATSIGEAAALIDCVASSIRTRRAAASICGALWCGRGRWTDGDRRRDDGATGFSSSSLIWDRAAARTAFPTPTWRSVWPASPVAWRDDPRLRPYASPARPRSDGAGARTTRAGWPGNAARPRRRDAAETRKHRRPPGQNVQVFCESVSESGVGGRESESPTHIVSRVLSDTRLPTSDTRKAS